MTVGPGIVCSLQKYCISFAKENICGFGAFATIFLYYFFSKEIISLNQLTESWTFSHEHCDNWLIAKVFFCKWFQMYGM